jgi:hypothetical protein
MIMKIPLFPGEVWRARPYAETDHQLANGNYIQGRSVADMIAEVELARPEAARGIATEVLAASMGVA